MSERTRLRRLSQGDREHHPGEAITTPLLQPQIYLSTSGHNLNSPLDLHPRNHGHSPGPGTSQLTPYSSGAPLHPHSTHSHAIHGTPGTKTRTFAFSFAYDHASVDQQQHTRGGHSSNTGQIDIGVLESLSPCALTALEEEEVRRVWLPQLFLHQIIKLIFQRSCVQFFFVCCIYLILCVAILCSCLLWTPLGYQGYHASNLPPHVEIYAKRMWAEYDARLPQDAYAMTQHPSNSLALAKLKTWRMIPPPMPELAEDLPVSPPNDAQGSLLPPIPVSPSYDGSVPNYPLGDSFQIVTFASSVYYERVLNLIGSAHVWEPTQRLVIYDLGFTQSQVLELQCVENIELRPFNFSTYPKHVRNLFQYYFKPLLVYDALQHADSVLCLDSGVEIRQQLHGIKYLLERDGYFLAGQPNTIGHKSLQRTFDQLGVAKAPYDDIQFCAGGMFGFVKNAPAYKLIAEQAAMCAMKPSCYSPKGGGRDNHNFDQSINSILVYKVCCERA